MSTLSNMALVRSAKRPRRPAFWQWKRLLRKEIIRQVARRALEASALRAPVFGAGCSGYHPMRENLPPVSPDITVTCACGNTFKTRSTRGTDFSVDICGACHPFYTGKQKLMDTAGRVDRFRKKYAEKPAAA